MPIATIEEFFEALLRSRTPHEVRGILTDIGDYADVEIDQPFGQYGLQWHPFGDNLSNISSVGLGTKPGRSLTERLTNAFDAILEARVPVAVAKLPESCREAAKQCLGRPVSGL